MITTTTIKTPIGNMIAAATNEGLCMLDFEYRKMMPVIKKRVSSYLNSDFEDGDHPLFEQVNAQLEEYFSGVRENFDLPLVMSGTDFQKAVWNALLQIPYGKTRTYMEQAKILGDVNAIRAVARANGENCLGIIIPCHRIIGSDGSLTGYAGGLRAKKWLLEHEAKHSGSSVQQAMF